MPATTPSAFSHPVTLAHIRRAADRIRPFVHVTPLLTCSTIDALAGPNRRIFFKCENFQKIGAFKIRGATNAVMSLSDEIAKKGVVTHSSGNHAQAIALAARRRNIPAYIVMPKNSSPVKIRAVEGYGGIITLCEPNTASRHSTAESIAGKTGATLIPPYDHPDIIAGQGTLFLEILQQFTQLHTSQPNSLSPADAPHLDAIVAPVGGGGLMSGVTIAAKSALPNIKVFAAEPQGADDAARSKAANTFTPQENPTTIADGLLTSLGELTWPVVRDLVDRVFTVSESQIISAMRLVFERMKIVIEPSSAVTLAAVLSDEFKSTQLPREHSLASPSSPSSSSSSSSSSFS
ncbi:MAG TPA: pyridoxal-phosphate dependent enzyme, partial [Phycisphaerales bacterium]|nr:pyridoxal-phosphate dependent enzyme [Phycisphaerales bacterium]